MSRWDTPPSDLVLALRARLDDGVSLRKAAGIIGQAFASPEDGPSPQTISNWAKGTVGITLNANTQQGLARLLDTSPRRVLELAGFDLDSEESGGHPILTPVAA